MCKLPTNTPPSSFTADMSALKALPQRRKFAASSAAISSSIGEQLEPEGKRERVVTQALPAADLQSASEQLTRVKSEEESTAAGLNGLDGVASEFYEYLDHTADVQCHAWGASLPSAFASAALCMCNYMTDLSRLAADSDEDVVMEVRGHDLESLLFNYLDEILYRFCTDSFCPTQIHISSLDRASFTLTASM